MYQFLANLVLIIHLIFIMFVIGGGLLALYWPRIAWLHLPAVCWGALIEFLSWICPLTWLENHFLRLAGEASYHQGFIARYLWPLIYPTELTPRIQTVLGCVVIVLNSIIYTFVFIKAKRRRLRP